MAELHWLSASELAAKIGAREVSSVEVLEAYMDRISRHNAALNAVVTVSDAARARAREADAALARGECWGPLHGVPVTLKDCIETAGMRTTAGFGKLSDHVPTEDATVVARLKAAGAVVLGKTNLSTLTVDCRSVSEVFGRTGNPWDPKRTPGGSSGGSAAAVAAGFTAVDFGSDAGGSVRIPAHFCGVFGLKPTAQRVSLAGHIPDLPGAVRTQRLTPVIGPLARSVDDLYLALQVIAGADGRDFDVPPVPVRPLPAMPSARGLRVAWCPTLPGAPASLEVRSAVAGFIARLEAEGCRVEEQLPALDFDDAWQAFWQFQTMVFVLAKHFNHLEDTMGPIGTPPTIIDRFENLHQRDRCIRAWDDLLATCDVFVLPAVMTHAFERYEPGELVDIDGEKVDSGCVNNHCCLFNYTGHPAVVIPLTKSADGMPIGLQLVGRRWHDEELLAVAKLFAEIAGPIGHPSLLADGGRD